MEFSEQPVQAIQIFDITYVIMLSTSLMGFFYVIVKKFCKRINIQPLNITFCFYNPAVSPNGFQFGIPH